MMRAVVLMLGAVAGFTAALPVEAATRSAVGRARTVKPIVLVNTQGLNFGRLIAGTTAGTVTINATSSARTRSGGVVLLGGTPTRALFTATGTPGVNAFITIGTPPVLTRSSGPGTVTVSNMTLNGGRTRRIPASGVLTIGVGGRLNVAANQADGLYTGSFNLTVDYP